MRVDKMKALISFAVTAKLIYTDLHLYFRICRLFVNFVFSWRSSFMYENSCKIHYFRVRPTTVLYIIFFYLFYLNFRAISIVTYPGENDMSQYDKHF